MKAIPIVGLNYFCSDEPETPQYWHVASYMSPHGVVDYGVIWVEPVDGWEHCAITFYWYHFEPDLIGTYVWEVREEWDHETGHLCHISTKKRLPKHWMFV